MSACARRFWGSGTACAGASPQADSPAAKEMAARLAAMQAERQRQDSAWQLPPAAAASPAALIRNSSQQNAPQQQKPNLR
jgi:hypothetical protein